MPAQRYVTEAHEEEEVHAHEEEEVEEYQDDHDKKDKRRIRKFLTQHACLIGAMADLFFVFYLTCDLDFTNENMPAHERRTQYMNIAYAAFHGARVISYMFCALIDDMYARRQYFNIWWITSPLFLLTGISEIVFNTDQFITCSICFESRKEWLAWYVPLVTVHIAIFLRVAYCYYDDMGEKYMKKDHMEEEAHHEEEEHADNAEENEEENFDQFNAQFVTVKGKKIIRSKKY